MHPGVPRVDESPCGDGYPTRNDLARPIGPVTMPLEAPWIAGFPGPEIAVVVLAFACGATFGSFINVVVHRVPRGESPIRGRSRCPACGRAIRPYDNVPVLGWLMLGGRCRDCGTAISSRYPLVEAVGGGVVAAVAAAELVGGGRWLPGLAAGAGRGIDRLLVAGDWVLLLSCMLHAGVLLAILAWCLMPRQCGGRTCPGAAGIIVTVVAVVVTVPAVGPVGLLPDGTAWPQSPTWLRSLCGAIAGVAAGTIAGRIVGGDAARCCLQVLGAALGWQAVTIVTIVTAAAAAVARSVGHRDFVVPAVLVPLAVAQIAFWGPIAAAWRRIVRLPGG